MRIARHPAVLLKGAPASLRALLHSIVLGLVYLALTSAYLWFIQQPFGISLAWFPSGLALAVLLLIKRPGWLVAIPVLFIANTCANLLGHNSLPVSLAFALSKCLEAGLIASLLVRFAKAVPGRAGLRVPISFERKPDVLVFMGIVILGSVISTLLGSASARLLLGAPFGRVWLSWWVADGLGIVMITPLIMVWSPGYFGRSAAEPVNRQRWKLSRVIEAAVLASGVFITARYLFLSEQASIFASPLWAYLLFPLMAWAGLRFNQRFVTGLLAITGMCAILGALNHLGQFPDHRLLAVQLYLGVLVFTTFMLSATFNEFKLTEDLLARSEAEYRNLFQAASFGIFHARPDGGFIRVNPTLASMLGYSSPDELVSAISDVAGQFYINPLRYAQMIEVICKQDNWVYAEGDCRRKNGNLMTGRLSARRVLAKDGSLAYLEGFVEDITERKRAEDEQRVSEQALRQSEQKFRNILEASPTAMHLYKLEADGSLVLTGANPTADRMLGISHQLYFGQKMETVFPGLLNLEFVGMCRQVALGELGIQALELQYRDESYEGIYDVHVFQTSPGLISVDFVDISERKRAELIAQARLRLVEYAITHDLDDLLRATLDEAEELTGSQVGFYHFLERDQRTLVLQTWSTRTMEQYCQAQGQGIHYPVNQAGVWVDCIRERVPVIHNDYAALPHHKGLPDGHTELVRELVVPVLRGERIVSILGVGNKPRLYSQGDVKVVSQLADLAWDIAERKRAEQALRKSETLLNEAQTLSKLGGWEYDRASKKMIWTREVYRIYGVPEDYDPTEVSRDVSLYLPEDRLAIEKAFYDVLNAGEPFDLELRFINAQGIHLWLHTRGNPVIVDGRVVKVTGNIMDITANKLAEETLRRVNKRLEQQLAENEVLQALLVEQSMRDSLTGLYNRRYMDDTLERELARASRGAYPISVMMIDIDLFKSFNDCHGHATGDRVLVVLGDLLRSAVRESDVACRYGGEEFVVILPGASLEDALQRAESIRQGFGSIQLESEKCNLTPTVSVGVAEYPRHGTNGDELLRAADNALYMAKAGGRNCVKVAESLSGPFAKKEL